MNSSMSYDVTTMRNRVRFVMSVLFATHVPQARRRQLLEPSRGPCIIMLAAPIEDKAFAARGAIQLHKTVMEVAQDES